MQDSRLFKMIYYLIEHGKTSAPRLAEKFEVSVRTIYRDIDVISSAGIPIYVTTGRNGGIQIADDFVMDKTMLSDKEKEDILMAMQSIAKIDADNRDTVTKLSSLFRIKNDSWLEVDLSRWGYDIAKNNKFEMLKKAISEHKMVNITYANTKGEIKDRVIWPLKMVYKASDWYVKAYCLQQAAFRIFKLTRIITLKMTDQNFTPLKFPQEQLTRYENAPVKVVLSITKDMAFRAYDEFAYDQIVNDSDGNLIVTTYMPLDDWVVGYILSFGANIKVLEPASLGELVKQEAEKIWKN